MTIQSPRNERSQQLIRLNDARRALANAHTVEEIKEVRERAELVRSYAQTAALGLEIQNFASELKLQAERLGGRLLAEMRLRGGARRCPQPDSPRLRDMGIDKNQSARWQLAATVPEPVFRQFVCEHHDAGKEISSAALLRLAKRLREESVEDLLVRPGEAVGVDTSSHLLAVNWTSLDHLGRELEGLADSVREIRSHYRLLMNVMDSICTNAKLTEESTNYRALQRYVVEIQRDLRSVDDGLQRICRHPELNGFTERSA